MIDDSHYWGPCWLEANDRIRKHPRAAEMIAAGYGRDWKHGRRTAVCAASMNTAMWQDAVKRAYPVVLTKDTSHDG